MKFWPIIGNGVIAGIAAGLVLAILILAFTTPLILQAEKYEHLGAAEHDSHITTDQANQRNLGTLIGTLIVSIMYGLLLSLIYNLRLKLFTNKPLFRGLILGLAGFALVVFIPSLAFPFNPPGVESTASPALRQVWWLFIIFAELIGVVCYVLVRRFLSKKNFVLSNMVGLAAMGSLMMIPFFIGPPNAIKESLVPDQLLQNFRLVNLAILFVFWATLGFFLSLQNILMPSRTSNPS